MAQLQHNQAFRFQLSCCLQNQVTVQFVSFRTAKERLRWLVATHFNRERVRFAQSDIRRIARDEIKFEEDERTKQI